MMFDTAKCKVMGKGKNNPKFTRKIKSFKRVFTTQEVLGLL